MGSKDIRDFFIEEEDTNDEMAHPLVDRQSNKRGKVASSALSMEEALEIALSLAKVARNKKQEAKSGIMAWEKMRAIAVVEYLKMRLSNIGKMVASAKCTINVYKNGVWGYRQKNGVQKKYKSVGAGALEREILLMSIEL